jgi:hypothetical protein
LILELGEPDQDERQERTTVPLVVEQDVEVVEHVLVEEVPFVQQKDWVYALSPELFDVCTDGVEDACRGGGWRESERQAQLSIEVSATERGVVTVRESVNIGRQSSAKRAQYARLADSRLAGEQDRSVSLDRFGEFIDELDLRAGQPEVVVADLFGKRRHA